MSQVGNVAETRANLLHTVVQLQDRCLYQTAKWVAELLNAIPEEEEDDDIPMQSPTFSEWNYDKEEKALEAKELSKYLMAKSFFDCREFDRCAAVFLPDTVLAGVIGASTNMTIDKGMPKVSIPPPAKMPRLSQKALFLALYAKMMAGEKRKDEDTEMVMGPHDSGKTVNKELARISQYLHRWFEDRKMDFRRMDTPTQGWLEYLYGVVLSKEHNEPDARKWLIKSTHLLPFNWGCYLELTKLVTQVKDLAEIEPQLPSNFFAILFQIHTSLELYACPPGAKKHLDDLIKAFPTSGFLISALGLHAYNAKDFALAANHFSNLLALHPHRLETLDHYSNLLYVMGSRPKLAFLAHLCSSIDKFRPETCVIIGNYYSQISQHEKAVNYFRRALTLDRSMLSAWTLMGHEYVELKNTHAAIEAYRRAVDVNRRDYRAWYGLGQTYEVLEMHAYALWYYKRACGLRPWDGKMWAAVGACLQKMGRDAEGIKAFKRTLLADPGRAGGPIRTEFDEEKRGLDTEVCYQIASMYERLGDEGESKGWMELCVAQETGYDSDDEEENPMQTRDDDGLNVTIWTSKARMWLAKKAMENKDYQQAMIYAEELCFDGQDVEEAKALVRDLRARGVEIGGKPMGSGGGAPRMSLGGDADVSRLLSSP